MNAEVTPESVGGVGAPSNKIYTVKRKKKKHFIDKANLFKLT